MQTIGAASAVAIAGCLGATEEEDPADPEDVSDAELEGLPPAESLDVDRVAADPADIPPPVDWDEPRTHELTLETVEVTAEVEPGVTVDFMTYDGQIPGPMTAEVGETVRVYFASGGPNLTSALHPIGNVWSRYYRDGDLLSEPGRNVETAPIAPGTVSAGEMELRVPGPVKLVDHALSRAVRKGMLGVIDVRGDPDPEIYDEDP